MILACAVVRDPAAFVRSSPRAGARRVCLPAAVAAADRAATVARRRDLSAPVEIVRDADAIPHIFAVDQAATRSSASATCTRRIACGRWSFSGGSATAGCRRSSAPPTLPQDRFLRTVGFGRAARSAWERLPADAQAADRRLRRRRERLHRHASRPPLPPEFTLLRFEPEPWTGPDVLVVGEDDGVGSERELLARAAAPRHRGARRRRNAWRS